MEQFANNCSTLVAAGGYTAAAGVLNVSSTAAPFPQVGNFSVVIFDATTKLPKVVLTVTAINSGTQFAVTAEGTDANAAAGDLVQGPAITARVMKNIGWVLLDSKTANDSPSLDFTGVISSLYDEYIVEIVGLIPATDAIQFLMRFSTNNGSSFDSGANYRGAAFRSSAAGNASASTGTTSISLSGNGTHKNTSTEPFVGQFRIFDPLSASKYKRVLGNSGANDGTGNPDVVTMLSATYVSTTAVNAFQILASSGNITSGTIRIYGLAK